MLISRVGNLLRFQRNGIDTGKSVEDVDCIAILINWFIPYPVLFSVVLRDLDHSLSKLAASVIRAAKFESGNMLIL